MKATVDAMSVEGKSGTGYPPPFDEMVVGRFRRRLGNVFGLTQFGVNLTVLPPGSASAQRHWHEREDEFVYVLEGEVVLVNDGGETVMGPGMCAGFRAGDPNGHHLVNRSGQDAVILEVGTRGTEEVCHYPDVDMRYEVRGGKPHVTRKDGTAFE
jgi:uncharacterized cupin superfamily protein